MSNWDWPAIVILGLVAAVQQFVVHKRWKALIEAIRDRKKNGRPD